MRLPTLSIRWKMTLLYSLVLGLLLAGFSLYLYFSVEQLLLRSLNQTFDAHFQQSLAARPQIVAELSTPQPVNKAGELSSPPSEVRHLSILESLDGPGLFLQVRDRDGKVLATTNNLGDHFLPPPTTMPVQVGEVQKEQIQLPVAGLLPEAASSDLRQARFELGSALVLDQNGQVVGILQQAQSLFEVDQVQDNLVDVVEQGVGVALLVALLAGLGLTGNLLKPIAKITLTARQIGSSGDLSRRIVIGNKPRPDEVGKLAGAFNGMLERLERSFKAQKQFVEDASHELKTPLTAILGHANLLRRRGRTNPGLVEEAAVAIIEEAERLQRLTQDLLYLARAGQSQELLMEPVALARLVQEVVQELEPVARGKAIELTASSAEANSTDSYLVRGDQDKLKQLLLNLADNALKFTPAGGIVRIETSLETGKQRQTVVVRIEDNGRGIAAEELPHIFERFYRADKARSRGEKEAGGSGLGLAIAQEVARRHGGIIEVKSQPGLGSVFSLKIPALE